MVNVAVGGLSAGPGEKIIGVVDALEKPTSKVQLPLAIINSGVEGPTLVLTAGIHGTEYPGIEAATRLMREIEPADIRGILIVFPIVNVLGFEAGETNAVPDDGMNLNRVFPGSPDGTASFVLAHFLLTAVCKVADYVVDMHGGDASEMLNPFAIYCETGNKDADARSAEMARLYNTAHIWAMSAQHGHRGTFVTELNNRGIPALVGEAGYLGTCNEEEIGIHLNGVHNIMRYVGMLDGQPEHAGLERQRVFRENFAITVRRAGVFEPVARPSSHVRKNEVLGRVKNFWGDIVEEVISPVEGIIRTLFPRRVVHSGSLVYRGWVGLGEIE
jgi:predicted deacylase